MNIFKSLKHWQLFLVFFAPILMPGMMRYVSNPMALFMIVWILWMGIVFLWMQTIGLGSNQKLDENLRKDTKFFRFAPFLPIGYGLLLFVSGFPQQLTSGGAPPFWLVPLHLFSMVCIFYMLWFSLKQLGTLKHGNETKFMDYSGIFF